MIGLPVSSLSDDRELSLTAASVTITLDNSINGNKPVAIVTYNNLQQF